MPIIMHIDFNSFFANVEAQANPFLRGKAIAVGGKGSGPAGTARSVVTTASATAKARGVKTGMATWQAKKICPELIVVPGDPQKYSAITRRLIEVCEKYADQLEQFSTDEVFLDVTRGAQDYFGATCLAQTIRAELKERCGAVCTASIGVAPNLLVAKLASESMKPNGLTVVLPEHAAEFVRTQPLKNFCGIGRRIEKRLEALGATTVDTLLRLSKAELLEEFDSTGEWLYNAARGIGPNELHDDEAAKSFGHSYTFPHDLLTREEVHTNLLGLADRVAARLRRSGVAGKHLSVYVRYGDMTSTGVSKQYRETFDDGLVIERTAWHMIAPLIDWSRGIRLLGVTVSYIVPANPTGSIFIKSRRMPEALAALDKVQHKYGQGAWQRASTLRTNFRERTSGWHYDHELVGTVT